MSKKEFELEIEKLQKQIQEQQSLINQYGLFRLFALLAGAVLVISGLIDQQVILLLGSVIPLGIFMLIVSKQNQAKHQLAYAKAHLLIDKKWLLRKSDAWLGSQTKLITEDIPFYLEDLDVLGKDSLYEYLCCCSCEVSQKSLYHYLKTPLTEVQRIKEMQAVFAELSQHPTCLNLLVEEAMLSHQERKLLQADDFEALGPMPLYLKIFTFAYPFCVFLSLFLMKYYPAIIFIVALFGIIVAGLHFDLWQQAAKKAERQFSATEALGKLARVVIETPFQHPLLREKQARIQALDKTRRKLGWIDQLFKMRNNPLLLFILDGLLFYDGILYFWFSKQPSATYLLELQEALGEWGALCALSSWLIIKENTVFPKISDHLSAVDLKHPLMNQTKAVGATFDFKQGAVVITGSNMAGKTTFMRNLGLNMVLLSMGLSVDAKHFEAPLMELYTSMRVADRTQEGVSTFYGELLRIKSMIACAKQQQPALFLIDEIFKGTNLKDRVVGAKAVIKQLSYPGAFLFVSTHDEQLCAHEEVAITNIHFSEYYQDGKIYFDYLLKPGICQTTNAHFLMQMIGLLE